jgi:hypothetical protein
VVEHAEELAPELDAKSFVDREIPENSSVRVPPARTADVVAPAVAEHTRLRVGKRGGVEPHFQSVILVGVRPRGIAEYIRRLVCGAAQRDIPPGIDG